MMEVNEEIHEGSPTPQRLKNIRAINNGVWVLHIVYVSTYWWGKCTQHICGRLATGGQQHYLHPTVGPISLLE